MSPTGPALKQQARPRPHFTEPLCPTTKGEGAPTITGVPCTSARVNTAVWEVGRNKYKAPCLLVVSIRSVQCPHFGRSSPKDLTENWLNERAGNPTVGLIQARKGASTLWPVTKAGPLFVYIKFYRHTATLLHLRIFKGCFHATMAEITDTISPQSLKSLLSGPLQTQLAHPSQNDA